MLKKEKNVLALIKRHLELLKVTTKTFGDYFKNRDSYLLGRICCFEEEADSIRKEVLTLIFKGAFFPYIRPLFYNFIDQLEKAFDAIVHSATILNIINLDPFVIKECIEISFYNEKICEYLILAFDVVIEGKDIKRQEELSSKIKYIEKKIDNIKLDVFSKLYCVEVSNFWQGKFLSDLFNNLISFSDIIEDASDILSLISKSFE